MYNLPPKYIEKQTIPKEELIKQIQTTQQYNLIKQNILKVKLLGHIFDDEVSSIVSDNVNVQNIQFFEIKLKNLNKVYEVSLVLQTLIKTLCVINFYTEEQFVKSYCLKRLDKTNKNEITKEEQLLTLPSYKNFSDYRIKLQQKYLNYENIVCRENKVLFYREIFIKAYIIENNGILTDVEQLLNSRLWYNWENMTELYQLLIELKENKVKLKSTKETRKKTLINVQINKINIEIQNLIFQAN